MPGYARRNAHIFRQGDAAQSVYIILKGAVDVAADSWEIGEIDRKKRGEPKRLSLPGKLVSRQAGESIGDEVVRAEPTACDVDNNHAIMEQRGLHTLLCLSLTRR